MGCEFEKFFDEKLHEECGVFGIYGDGNINPSYACYNGLLALQHRGQESCGIAVNDCGVIKAHKDMGGSGTLRYGRWFDHRKGR